MLVLYALSGLNIEDKQTTTMHDSAYQNAAKFYNEYLKDLPAEAVIVDVGSYEVDKKSMKPIFSKHRYIGVDICKGPNVDIINKDYVIPLADESCDAVVSSSCFEHDEMFWLTFLEMVRLVKPNGYIYICAPSTGPYHGYPGDCWRFYKDSWKALAAWAKRNGKNITLVKNYIDNVGPRDEWHDNVGIYHKPASN